MIAEKDNNLSFAMRPLKFLKEITHHAAREALALLPRRKRYRVFRFFAEYDPAPNPRLVFKIADTREELEAGRNGQGSLLRQPGFTSIRSMSS